MKTPIRDDGADCFLRHCLCAVEFYYFMFIWLLDVYVHIVAGHTATERATTLAMKTPTGYNRTDCNLRDCLCAIEFYVHF